MGVATSVGVATGSIWVEGSVGFRVEGLGFRV